MQTFMPYGTDYSKSAKSLDNKRLGKQRVETYQILKALLGESKGWTNHPATKMWRGHEFQLYEYQTAICAEWSRRGFKDTVMESTKNLIMEKGVRPTYNPPDWASNKALAITHRANLYLKDPIYYAWFEDEVKVYIEYVCCPEKCKYWWYTHTLERRGNGKKA
jgi:hypothetical protein